MAKITLRSSNLDNIVAGDINAKWSVRGDKILRYYIDIRHKKLNIHKELSAPEIFILQGKMDALLASWDEKYAEHLKKQEIKSGQVAADDLHLDANQKFDSLTRILVHTLSVDDKVDWELLKDNSKYDFPKNFPEREPFSKSEEKPIYETPKIGFFELIFGKKSKIIEAAQQHHSSTVLAWEDRERRRLMTHANAVAAWKSRQKAFWDDHLARKTQFEHEQAASHMEVERLKSEVAVGNEEAVIEHASLVLEKSNYFNLFDKKYLIQYQRENKLMKIAYDIPSINKLPDIKSVKFVKATGELKEARITDRDKKGNFESVAYQICLRTLHEIFEADERENIKSILFNGFVDFIDPATGVEQRSCLLSILVKREDFLAIDLSRVEPKTCFKSLKGVSAASLASMAPIPPIMEMDTEDRRFIEAREVGSSIDQSTNLASISWEDFEHLVRQLFEREFESRGGVVKVTQSSSDGGVDAIALDPDPITGGKIVIQAKRYTRTVGVSAVRDLYGTLMNEGASRAILVTTADYGPDAYSFANGKPVTLMNGANLLHMMEKHGFNAKIDLQEARAMRSQS